MTKMTQSSCVFAALLCLTIGSAIAEENTEAQQTKPDVTSNPENQPKPKPKEEPASTKPSQGSETKAAEPECNQ